ncbi:MAG: hypothetical protein HY647_02885 [Acidobacteria bacterium]|nr:hypothetical protein [Acidobacteriota bacterium]
MRLTSTGPPRHQFLVGSDQVARRPIAIKNGVIFTGARAAKVCGAGGGGCLFFLVEPEAKGGLESALGRAGVRVIPFEVAARGLEARP